jgi:hypothetical protein
MAEIILSIDHDNHIATLITPDGKVSTLAIPVGITTEDLSKKFTEVIRKIFGENSVEGMSIHEGVPN